MPAVGFYSDPRDNLPGYLPEELKAKYQEIVTERTRHQDTITRLEAEYKQIYNQWQASQPGAAEFARTQAKLAQLDADQTQRDRAAAAALAQQHLDALQAEERRREQARREWEQITGSRI